MFSKTAKRREGGVWKVEYILGEKRCVGKRGEMMREREGRRG